jgi:hypothetical protein
MEEKVQHYYASDGKLFPAEEVHGVISAIFEGIAKEFIRTSRTPKSLVMRMAIMQKNPALRARVWREAINHLLDKNLTVNADEIKGKYHVTKIDFAKVKLDNRS